MTAIALVFERSGEPVSKPQFERILSTLSHRGPDGSNLCTVDNVVLGAQHFWTTPEDVNCGQPASTHEHPFLLLLDGRIDNRAELVDRLGIPAPRAKNLSDAQLLLSCFIHWGERFVSHVLGPFACIVADPMAQTVLCCRDPLGARTLYYYLDNRRFVVASEEQAVLAHPAVSSELDELTLARYFTIREPSPGRTVFKQVRELTPATCLRVTRQNVSTWQYWQPVEKQIRYHDDAEYAEHYRELLTESVRCRMRSVTLPAVQMSGGLDSTSVAAVAARLLSAGTAPQRLNTVSYVFRDLSSVDESANIDAMAAHLPINSLRFNGDECWPRHDLESWPQNPNRPDVNMYRLLAQTSYRMARLTGARVLFTGAESDNHYSGSTEWLFDLLCDGKFLRASAELLRFGSPVQRRRAEPELLYLSARRVLGRLRDALLHPPPLHAYDGSKYPWLTPMALSLLNEATDSLPPTVATRSLRWQGIFTSGIKWLISNERYFGALEGIEVRRPFYDRRLVEFMLAIPSYLLYNQGYLKYILRSAMRDHLPEVVRGQTRRTVYSPLFRVALEREQGRLASVLAKDDIAWSAFIRRDWMELELPKQPIFTRGSRNAYLVGDWCIALDAWIGTNTEAKQSIQLGDGRKSL